jgi:hypothetical protein
MVELYLHSPICLHGIMRNYIIKYRDNFYEAVYDLMHKANFLVFTSHSVPRRKKIRHILLILEPEMKGSEHGSAFVSCSALTFVCQLRNESGLLLFTLFMEFVKGARRRSI